MSISYATGNWSVKSLYADSITELKTLSLPDLNFATDYSKTEDEPSEARVTNVSGSELTSPESIRFGVSAVKDVYSNSGVDAANQLTARHGVQTLVEIHENYRATNSVTGEEFDLPCVGRVVLRFPTVSCVTGELVNDLLRRTVAACFSTGSVDISRELELAKSSLVPSNM